MSLQFPPRVRLLKEERLAAVTENGEDRGLPEKSATHFDGPFDEQKLHPHAHLEKWDNGIQPRWLRDGVQH